MSVFGGNSDDNQKDYTWEIRDIEDVNDWMENFEIDINKDDCAISDYYCINEIKNSKGTVYQLINNTTDDIILSRDLKVIIDRISKAMCEWKITEEGYNDDSEEAAEIHKKFTRYKVLADKQADLKSNRIIKDIDSANQWITDLGYEGAIRINVNNIDYDKRIYWKIEVLINNEWKQYGIVAEYKIIIKGINCLVIPEVEIPEMAVERNIMIDSLEAANQWLQSLEKGSWKFVYRKNPFYKENYFLINDRKSIVTCAITLKDCIINSCSGRFLNTEIPNISDKLGIAPEKELRTIRSVRDANDWLKSIGKDKKYIFQYTEEEFISKGRKGTIIHRVDLGENSNIFINSKNLMPLIDATCRALHEAVPLCKDTIFDIITLNMWLDTIDFKGGRRPHIFKKKTENGNIYSVWDIYKEKGNTETRLEFISTSLEISLAYIVITRKLKDYLWDVQLKKESVKKGSDITINNLETANKWVDSLGYKNHLRFNCMERVQNTPNGKVRFPAYFIQERLSGDNWKTVNNTFGKFDDILNVFCKLTNIKEIPKSTIMFKPQLVEEQKVSEIIQSVKGANLWFEKISIQGCKFRIKSREDKQNKRLYTIEFMNPQGQIGKFYECASLKESIDYFCKYYKIKVPAVAKNM